jgi:hypothetical protein
VIKITRKHVRDAFVRSEHDRGTLRHLPTDIKGFKRSFRDWARRHWQDEPVYCLPDEAIASLAKPISDSIPELLVADKAAEEAFTALCGRHFTVGFLASETIAFHPLSPRDFRLDELAVFFPDKRAASATLEETAKDHATRSLAYVGQLWCDSGYLADRDALRDRWSGLSESERPRLPLVRPFVDPRTLRKKDGMPFSEQGLAFVDHLVDFLNKWGLVQLSTWDLPDPQNILMVNPFPPGSPAAPAGGVNLHIPTGFRVLDRDQLSDKIQELQAAIARESGVEQALFGSGSVETFALKATVIHLERTVQQRFPEVPPRGFVSHVIRAAATILKRSEETVDRYRKEINRSLRKAVPTGND